MKILSGDQVGIEIGAALRYIGDLEIEHFGYFGNGVVDFTHKEDQRHLVTDWAFVQWVLFMEKIDERG